MYTGTSMGNSITRHFVNSRAAAAAARIESLETVGNNHDCAQAERARKPFRGARGQNVDLFYRRAFSPIYTRFGKVFASLRSRERVLLRGTVRIEKKMCDCCRYCKC